jgi:hypothetical protein
MNPWRANSMTDWRALADQLYFPLKSSPCRCSHKWEKGVITRVNHCSRCVALLAYEAAVEVSPDSGALVGRGTRSAI